jgi:hypothetical protein
MGRALKQASIHVVSGYSLVVPLAIEGLPEMIEALGTRWQRKREFHLTAVASRVIDELGRGEEIWGRVIEVASGRDLGPVTASAEVRRVRAPDDPQLQTLIVMVNCSGLDDLYRDLRSALRADITAPPAHITLYSTDPSAGIGIVDQSELADRAPQLSEAEQDEVRQAMGFP